MRTSSTRAGRRAGKPCHRCWHAYVKPQNSDLPSLTRGRSRMRESRTYGSVRGAGSNLRPYRDHHRIRRARQLCGEKLPSLGRRTTVESHPKRASLCQSRLFTEDLSASLRACQFHPECCCLLPCRRQRALQFAGDDACLRILPGHGLQRLDVFLAPGARLLLCCWVFHFREFLWWWLWLVTASRPTPKHCLEQNHGP